MVSLAKWTILVIILAHLQWEFPVFARQRRLPGKRRLQNSRTRFQQRINRLGQGKVNLIRTGRVGKSRALPSGFALLGGQVVDVTNKVFQKRIATGTAYYSFTDTIGRMPLYIRPGNEIGWHFIAFQDPFYWRGSGHLIVLKKVLGVNINKSKFQQAVLYDAYTISLRVSLHPRVHLRDPVYRRKLQKRRRKYGNVVVKRKQYQKPGFRTPHLQGRKGKFGKRKKREALTFSFASLGIGECLLTKLNVTSVLIRLKKQKSSNRTKPLVHKNTTQT